MRDKFRAWDKKRNEWYGESCPEILTFKGFAIFGECTLLCTPSIEDLQHLEITQFTGLKDKNGAEIYEGDILKGRYSYEIGVVEYGEHTFEYASESDGEDCNRDMDSYGYHCGYDKLHPYEASCAEVIGNIYQNPELLK